jgi:ArsR family transcriptional regulator
MRDLALFYTALSDPTRLRLLSLMRGGEVCVCHLQAVLKTNQPKISRHLAYLKKAGLVEARRDGKWMHYRLRGADGKFSKLLSVALDQLRQNPQIQTDAKGLKRVVC